MAYNVTAMSVKNKVLDYLCDYTNYYGCTFYLDTWLWGIKLFRCKFDNCSFRTKVKFTGIKECEFVNCNFSDKCTVILNNLEGVYTIPDDIFKCEGITDLFIHESNIEEIPDAIAQLKNLSFLRVAKACVTKISPRIGELKNLQILDLYHNELKVLPKELFVLPKLRKLLLGHNLFESINFFYGDVGLHTLKSLEHLVISNNPIASISEKLFMVKNLKRLYVDRKCKNFIYRMILDEKPTYFFDQFKSSVPTCSVYFS